MPKFIYCAYPKVWRHSDTLVKLIVQVTLKQYTFNCIYLLLSPLDTIHVHVPLQCGCIYLKCLTITDIIDSSAQVITFNCEMLRSSA